MSTKKVFSPVLGRNVSFGRKHPAAKFSLQFGKYKTSSLPTPPTSVDYSPKAVVALEQMYLNDQLGDCVIAAGSHMRGVTSGNATGTPVIFSSAQITSMYSAIGGYVPGNPATDNGCDEQTAGNYWISNGFSDGVKWLGFLGVDATNQTEVMQALDLFEGLMLGLDLPDAWVNPMPSTSGFVWDVAGPVDPNNGHAVCAIGYNAQGLIISTWGMTGIMTWAAVAEYCGPASQGQLFVAVSADMIAAGQVTSPSGFSWAVLQSDFATLGGSTIVVPTPVPVPAPAPAPVPTPTPTPTPVPAPPPPHHAPPAPRPLPPAPPHQPPPHRVPPPRPRPTPPPPHAPPHAPVTPPHSPVTVTPPVHHVPIAPPVHHVPIAPRPVIPQHVTQQVAVQSQHVNPTNVPSATFSFTQALTLVHAGHSVKRLGDPAGALKHISAADMAATDWVIV